MAIQFDTLRFVEKLKSAGIPEAKAKAEAEALATALGESTLGASSDFQTKAGLKDAFTGIKIEIADIKAELKIVKWTSATIVAGVIALITKAFV